MSTETQHVTPEKHAAEHAEMTSRQWLTDDQAAQYGTKGSRLRKGDSISLEDLGASATLGRGECGCLYVITPGTLQKGINQNRALLREIQGLGR